MKTLVAVSTIAALLGLLPMPYGYYMLLRIVLCLTAAVAFSKAWERNLTFWLWAFGVIAVLYNPILPVHLGSKGSWILVNLITLGFFWASLPLLRSPSTPEAEK